MGSRSASGWNSPRPSTGARAAASLTTSARASMAGRLADGLGVAFRADTSRAYPLVPYVKTPGPAESSALAAVEEFNADLHKSGAFRFAGGLHPPSSAKTVDATSGAPVVVDGPFVEAPEYVGGFWVIEAADEDAAVRWATQASKALGGRIEVRAFQEPQDA